ncbi:acetyltransferase [Rhodohalobacter barkolensis]|uniref:Sugar O-acyltransferase n=1 Tax=Rhodohalobacter barkolensis TaxID=2053187 RepID=A0A2N0VGD8_9BACT|nr:acetyltransferase [Rhodohalobacter barkolensis]PKD43239.1 sugar O-acyltransferase [Rhodohalobacter barkolensis]
MKNIIIVGSGGHGAELDDYIRYGNKSGKDDPIKILGYLDDNPDNYHRYMFSAPLLGSIKGHEIRSDCEYLIGIANLTYRRKIVEEFLGKGAKFITYIHPESFVSESAEIGTGSVISYHCNIGPNAKIGRYSLINARASVSHDCEIGDFNFIGPNVCLSGFTKVGDENMFGINSATIPGLSVGSRNKIAAGMTLDKNVEDDSTVFYKIKERVIAIPKSN